MLISAVRHVGAGAAIAVAIVVIGAAMWMALSSSTAPAAAGANKPTPTIPAPTPGAANAPATQGADPPNCTIGAITAEYGIDLEVQNGASVNSSSMQAAIAARYPSAEIVEEQTGLATSPNVPDVDGHDIVAFRLRGLTAPPAAGLPGRSVIPLTRTCTVTLYDAHSSGFLVDLIDSWP